MITFKNVIDDALAEKNMCRSRDPFGTAAEQYVRDDNKQDGILSDNYQNIPLQNVSLEKVECSTKCLKLLPSLEA